MANEIALDKRRYCLRLHIETIKKAEARFGFPTDDGASPALIRAIEEATRDVQLTAKDYADIDAEVQANNVKRIAKRNKEKGLK